MPGACASRTERLEIRVDIPGMEFDPGVDEELLSTYEAMHEDIYFSLLEFFQGYANRPPGDRGLQPGQIIPLVRRTDGLARVRMSIEPFEPLEPVGPAALAELLAQTTAPLDAGRIAGQMAQLGGVPFQAVSRQGRPVLGAYVAGPGPAVFISGRSMPTKARAWSGRCARRRRWSRAARHISP